MPDVRPISSFPHAAYIQPLSRFLFADPTPKALQVFRHASKTDNPEKAGPGEWINADPIPGCVVCNIGEMWEVSKPDWWILEVIDEFWQIWTNGLYKSTIHRVVHRGTNFR
jgi:isopenicillin N synthase-like dioxygenase